MQNDVHAVRRALYRAVLGYPRAGIYIENFLIIPQAARDAIIAHISLYYPNFIKRNCKPAQKDPAQTCSLSL